VSSYSAGQDRNSGSGVTASRPPVNRSSQVSSATDPVGGGQAAPLTSPALAIPVQ
jgi:hypothetical protein